MQRFIKGTLTVMAVMLAVSLSMAGSASAVTTLYSTDCGAVLGVAPYTDTDYVLGEDMVCTGTKHGLIIGAAGITIDGAGYKLLGTSDGSPPTARDCAVEIYDQTGGYECVEHGCRSEIDSGVYNAIADGVDGSGCDERGGILAGQGGCSDVTVKNLDIRGFCDGIFMSGTCFRNEDHVDGQLLIDGIVIEGNIIANNGMDCGTTFTTVTDTVGYWGTTAGDNAFFNDGIFVAMAGDEISASGFTECDADPVVIRDNDVFNQLGCGKESCPGGNAINLEGGVEDDYYGTEEFFYVGCVDVSRNLLKNSSFSGVQASHALGQSTIHANVIRGNGYGGITYPCDFGQSLTVSSNTLDSNSGPGIGTFSPMEIIDNTIMYEQTISFQLYAALNGVGFPLKANGIFFGGEASGTVVEGNIVGGTATSGAPILLGVDIATQGGIAYTAERNKCYETSTYFVDSEPYNGTGAGVGGCRYDNQIEDYDSSAWTPVSLRYWPYLRADINGDNVVDTQDASPLGAEYGYWETTLFPE